jgi:hypothetical protein
LAAPLFRELRQVRQRELATPNQFQDVRHEEFAMSSCSLARGEHAVIDPALDGADPQAERLGDFGGADVGR